MRILIVDDHPITRSGIRMCLRDLSSPIDFVEAADLQGAMRVANEERPLDLVLLDLLLPGFSGVEAVIAFRKSMDPCSPIVVFSATDDAATIIAALDAGAMGFVPKTSSVEVLRGALRIVLAHGVYVPPTVLSRHPPVWAGQAEPAGRQHRKLSELGLTLRQQDVCAQMVKGKSVKQMARHLGISPATVKVHLQPILRSLRVTNRTQAVATLYGLGFSPETDPSDDSYPRRAATPPELRTRILPVD